MNYATFLKYSSLIFIALGFLFLFGPKGWFASYYHPLFMSVLFLLSPLLVYLPAVILKRQWGMKKKSLLKIRSTVAFSLVINNAGELGMYQLYQFGFEYDKFAHFFVSLLFTFVLGEYLIMKKPTSFHKTLLLISLIMFSAGIVWEILEALSDYAFNTKLWGIYGEQILPDTFRDILFNSLGIVAGLFSLTIRQWKQKKA